MNVCWYHSSESMNGRRMDPTAAIRGECIQSLAGAQCVKQRRARASRLVRLTRTVIAVLSMVSAAETLSQPTRRGVGRRGD